METPKQHPTGKSNNWSITADILITAVSSNVIWILLDEELPREIQ